MAPLFIYDHRFIVVLPKRISMGSSKSKDAIMN
jgi:hypothetical protein